MRREERVTVQGPVKQQQPDGMSHRGGSACVWTRGCVGTCRGRHYQTAVAGMLCTRPYLSCNTLPRCRGRVLYRPGVVDDVHSRAARGHPLSLHLRPEPPFLRGPCRCALWPCPGFEQCGLRLRIGYPHPLRLGQGLAGVRRGVCALGAWTGWLSPPTAPALWAPRGKRTRGAMRSAHGLVRIVLLTHHFFI